MSILITGASSGFGAAMVKAFVGAGYRVIGVARRVEKLEALQQSFPHTQQSLFQPLFMDISKPESIQSALAHIAKLPEPFANIDCLINNAGLALGLQPAHQADFQDWHTMIQTNLVGLSYLTHQILPSFVAKKQGYIINIGSIAGNYAYMGGNVYGATKAFVRQFSLNLRADLHGTGVRVSNLEPGLVGGSEFSQVRFKGDEAKAASVYENTKALCPEDIANTALWLYQLPPHVNVNTLEIMPTCQSFSPLAVHREA
ncbi:MAG: SDR family oxidoreductase [Cardiobacteriaceae bacterium]|nr:SDR family oxidoreductase [Cardiobacteriaceae bacterium]